MVFKRIFRLLSKWYKTSRCVDDDHIDDAQITNNDMAILFQRH